jgi:putative transposon related peptidoglycan linked protein (LPXTG motif)
MSKATENSQSTTKKLYTGAVISALATGLVNTIGTAHADTVELPLPTTAKTEPALVEKEVPKKTEVKVPTKEEVAELGATAKQTQEDESKAKEVLDQANEKSDKAEKKVTDLKQDVADAQKVADTATPEVIQGAEKKVETAKASVPSAEQVVSSAQKAQDDADRNVAVQGKTVGTKQAEVTQAETGVADAKVEVKSAEDALDGLGLAEAKEAQDKAIKEESESKQAQVDAQKALDTAKTLSGELAENLDKTKDLVNSTSKSLETKKDALSDAKQAQEKANSQYNNAVSALTEAQNKVNGTKITLAPDFIQAVKDTIAYNKADISSLDSTERAKRTAELYQRVIQSQLGNANNKYVQTPSDLADTKRYDINKLPKEIRDELNYFVVDLLNQARKQLGLPDAVLSKTSLEFAQKIAEEYVKADFSNAMRTDYRKRGGAGHYAKGINNVARTYNMPTTSADVEARGGQYYENSMLTFAGRDFDDADGVYRKTLGEMKETLYNHFVRLISTKNDYAHTQGILQFDYPNETAYFGGVAQSKTNDFYITHFLTSVRSSLTNGSTWDTTPIENPLSEKYLSKQVENARNTLANALTVRKDAQNLVKSLEGEVKTLENTLSQANSKLESLTRSENPLVNAQRVFDDAKARHDKAVLTLSNANALVNTLSASQSAKEETLKDAQGKLKEAEQVLKTAQDTLKEEETKMAELEAIASNKAQAVSTAKKALQDAKDSVKQAEKELADLKGAHTRLKEAKAELEKAEAELKDAYKTQNEAKVDYEVKSLAADRAKTAYETAKAQFEEAETKRLVALADAKRKELEKAGHKPVPVVDNKGNVVDYKAEKVTVGTTGDKTYQAPAQATNAKAEPKKQLPNTGTKESNLLALLGAGVGLLALVGKRKFK